METTLSSVLGSASAWFAPGGHVASAAGAAAAGVGQATGHLNLPSLLALAAALGWASGLRLYAVVFLTGLAGALGWIALPPGLALLQHPAMLAASGFMLFVEFFADKIPGVDSLWDIVHSVIRIPAGAALAAGVFGADGGTMTAVAALLGGTLAATSQAAKTTSRAAINASPEPFSNVAASLTEDGLVVGALWLSTHHPLLFGVVLLVMVLLMWGMTWLLVKFLKAIFRRVSGFLSGVAKVA
ncbi:MAG: DUF4126 domain-containing protein [Burkholderiaceae bacterium]|nr:MAG: DUF4126 domain-containing protein [Burkholderiaceae bacterium]TBR72155.1 MAG: DUF4126 domain-containing protein [Burkholderiaceae bacterium]